MNSWTAAIAFARVGSEQNPNVRASRLSDPAEPYFKAMTVAFASLRRWNPALSLLLITNEMPPTQYADSLGRLGVSIRMTEFEHRPPEGFAARFNASLYMLDAMAACASQSTLFVDPDVLCIRPLDRMLQSVGERVGGLPIDYPLDHDINGLSRREAAKLHVLLGEPEQLAAHFGGECYVIPESKAEELRTRTELAWGLALTRHSSGLSRFTTEEHLLSYGLRAMPVARLDREVRRIWTAARYRTVTGAEDRLTLWHLPAEKDRGFITLYPSVLDADSWFWAAKQPDFARRAGRAMGMRERKPARFLRDLAGGLLAKVTR